MKKVILLFVSCLFIFTSCSKAETDNYKTITLFEAYQKFKDSAYEWNTDAKLVHITSVDETTSKNDGNEGKRKVWTAIFYSDSNKQSIVLSINDGKMTELTVTSEEIAEDQLIDKINPFFDSDEALKYAQKNYNLQLGKQWALGYNYTLYKNNSKTILCVIGEDSYGYVTKVYFDFDSGKCLSAERMVPTGGNLMNESQILIDDGFVIDADISPNYKYDNTIAVNHIVKPMSSTAFYEVKISTDKGTTWNNYTFDEPVVKIKFSDNCTLQIITSSNMYKLTTNKLILLKSFSEIIDADILGNNIAILTKDIL